MHTPCTAFEQIGTMYSLIVLIISLVLTLCAFLHYKYQFWKLLGLPQLETHWLLGHFGHLKSIHMDELFQVIYQRYRGVEKIVGAYIYTKPVIVVLDLDVVKSILIKDFNNFTDRLVYKNDHNDPLSTHLFAVHGKLWRPLRMKLSPTFTSGRMKSMLPLVREVAERMKLTFAKELSATTDGSIEMHDLLARYTTDVIGRCAFGIECNSLRDPNVEFRQMGDKIFYEKFVSVRWKLFKRIYADVLKHFGMRYFPQNIHAFFLRVITETVAMRERENIKGNDFLSLLIQLKQAKDEETGESLLTMEQLAAQVFVFFAAGFETSSSNICYALFELAKNPKVQIRLREEIQLMMERHENVLSYEAINEMHYLDQVISETLRKYPALAALTRTANEDYIVPGTKFKIPAGTMMYIPIKAIHYDPDIYDQPHEFRPERFDSVEVHKRHPQAFLGFGDGPRNCIGLRFARMQVRIGLIMLLQHFHFSTCDKTLKEMEFYNGNQVMVPATGIWLKVQPL